MRTDTHGLRGAEAALVLLVGLACGSATTPTGPRSGLGLRPAALEHLAKCNAEPSQPWRRPLQPDGPVPEAALAAYREGVERGAIHWPSYQVLAATHLARGELEAAARVFLRYPPFADPQLSRSPQHDAERAAAAAAELLWRGETAPAESLFAAAEKLAPTSHAGLVGGFQWAVLREDWQRASQRALERMLRCTGSGAVRDWVLVQHLIGRSEDADALFRRTVANQDTAPWVGAFVGLRLAGSSDADIMAWLSDPEIPFHPWAIQGQAWLMLLPDRAPSDAWPEQIFAMHEWMMRRRPKYAGVPVDRLREAARDSSAADAGYGEGYAHWLRGRFIEAWRSFRRASTDRGRPGLGPEWIRPYVLWSAVESGQRAALEREWERAEAIRREWLARRRYDPHRETRERSERHTRALLDAVEHGLAGDHAAAQESLRAALRAGVHGDGYWMLAPYQRLEIGEALGRASGDPGYAEVALELARRQARMEPWFAWSWAVIARHSASSDERRQALRRAVYLDRRSAILSGIPPKEMALARSWLESHAPFPERRTGSAPPVAGRQ